MSLWSLSRITDNVELATYRMPHPCQLVLDGFVRIEHKDGRTWTPPNDYIWEDARYCFESPGCFHRLEYRLMWSWGDGLLVALVADFERGWKFEGDSWEFWADEIYHPGCPLELDGMEYILFLFKPDGDHLQPIKRIQDPFFIQLDRLLDREDLSPEERDDLASKLINSPLFGSGDYCSYSDGLLYSFTLHGSDENTIIVTDPISETATWFQPEVPVSVLAANSIVQ